LFAADFSFSDYFPGECQRGLPLSNEFVFLHGFVLCCFYGHSFVLFCFCERLSWRFFTGKRAGLPSDGFKLRAFAGNVKNSGGH
jgi:hypothetical protein